MRVSMSGTDGSALAEAGGGAPGATGGGAPGATGGGALAGLDLAGYVIVPPLVEPHLHLDKVFLAERFPERDWTLQGAIDAWIAYCERLDVDDLVARGSEALRRYLAAGVTAVRAHVDTVPAEGLQGVEAALELRRRFAGLVDIEIVAGCFIPATGRAGAANLARLREALAAGATCVGGFPSLDPDPTAAVEALAAVAADCGAALDLHVDETTDPDIFALGRLIEVAAAGFPHPVNASHAVTLGLLAPERQRSVAASMAEAGLSVVSLPQTNLLLQGRGGGSLAPRGLTALRPLLEAGVPLGAGGDNIQDGFNPLGRADPFETASLLVAAGHLTVPEALGAVTTGAARVIGWPPGGPQPGRPADFVAVRAHSVSEAV
ncbi:MAG TPA: amidohydrolase family protein, partial [Acidimicrobiales bacterium]|nr:amidohydrolase family protein [Acidimicrobiales bacterium]